jgi:integrase
MRTKLSTKNVAAARPQDTPYEIWDTGKQGLLLRVQPSGVKSWVVQWGRGKRTTLKRRYPECTLDMARKQAAAILGEAADKGTPSAHQPKGSKAKELAGVTTFQDFIDKRYEPWVTAERKAGKATVSNIRAQFDDFMKKPLAGITAWQVEKFKADRLKAGTKPATVSRDLDRIRGALSKAVEWGLLPSNPITGVKRPKGIDNSRTRFLMPDEEKRLRKALADRDAERRKQRIRANKRAALRGDEARPTWAADEYTDHLTPIVLLAINTGLRRGELLGLTWEHVNLSQKTLTVAAGTAKSQKARHIQLNSEAAAVLERWGKGKVREGPVFPGAKGAITHFNTAWRALLVDAKLKDFHFHDTRHHFASRLAMAGVDLFTVQKLLGHSDPSMTQRYAHLADEHRQAAVEKLVGRR